MTTPAHSAPFRPAPRLARSLALLCAAGLSLLASCTGTEEPQASVQLALINAGGSELRVVSVGDSGQLAAGTVTLPVSGALGVRVLPGGSRLMVAFRDHLELRDAALRVVSRLAAPAGLTPCYVRLNVSPARDRLAALSDCGNGAAEQLVVYRSDGTLAFSATLPPPTPASSDLTRVALTQGGAVWVARPGIGGGSELLRADENGVQVVTNPPLRVIINDLAARADTLYAATDNGVRAVSASGALSETAVIGGSSNRLYGGDRLLAAWLAGSGAQPLTVFNGQTFGVAAYPSDLRDLTFAPDGNVYYLTATTLTRLDTVFGLRSNNWRPTAVASNLNDARAVTWLTVVP